MTMPTLDELTPGRRAIFKAIAVVNDEPNISRRIYSHTSYRRTSYPLPNIHNLPKGYHALRYNLEYCPRDVSVTRAVIDAQRADARVLRFIPGRGLTWHVALMRPSRGGYSVSPLCTGPWAQGPLASAVPLGQRLCPACARALVNSAAGAVAEREEQWWDPAAIVGTASTSW